MHRPLLPHWLHPPNRAADHHHLRGSRLAAEQLPRCLLPGLVTVAGTPLPPLPLTVSTALHTHQTQRPTPGGANRLRLPPLPPPPPQHPRPAHQPDPLHHPLPFGTVTPPCPPPSASWMILNPSLTFTLLKTFHLQRSSGISAGSTPARATRP
ncbi:hypothetical protein LDENG_00178030 [Lucifuga dentata]|nr:hypothetical protein LDENG_00178030 [Lucifuga dentata]